ncbi:MAG: gliding motility-associated C-terminal domain-containing protein [Bacteroidota bacterium]
MKKILTIAFAFTILLIQQTKASHIAGGDLSYVCLGGNQYQINLNLFVDCLGFDPGAQQSIDFSSTCGGTANLIVDVTNPGGTEISQLCVSQIDNSTCNGGNLPGMWVFHYTGTVTLAPACDAWTMSWSSCCRNSAILNLQNPDSGGSYIEALLNSATAPCNNSPSFTSQPIPYVCANQQVNYNYGVVETDGDSLYYSLINAMDAGATNLGYASGYSAAVPIPGITINPITGLLTFTPTSLGNFVVVILVKEYDNNGVLIGEVMRDIQFVVQNCSNLVPDPTGGTISNLTGTAVQTGPFAIELCEGSTFTFEATFADPNPTDTLTLVSNIATVLPGATLDTTGTNPLVVTISWVAPGGSANTNTSFSVTVSDGACPVVGQQTAVYDINVQPRTLGGPDKIICGPQSATMNGTGGSTFTWSVLTGPAMVVGGNFSCNPCANPVASPASTTTYEVVSDLSGTCVNKDTVTIMVVPDFTFVTSQTTDTLCLQQLVQLSITGTPAAAYTYLWTPDTYLNFDTVANPIANVTVPGTYDYYVNITSPAGCLKKDTATVTILPEIRTRVGADTILCAGQSTTLNGTGGNTFTWSVISGPAIVVGTNFSCNPCANPVAKPSATTVYQVTSNLNGTCINKDTVTVTVVPDFTTTVTQSETITCLLQPPIQINISSLPAGSYNYVWSPAGFLNNAAIDNPIANITVPGTHHIIATITAASGCVKKDTATIIITPSYKPDLIPYAADSIICVADTAQLGVTFATSIPSVCGTNPIGCSGALVATIGTGTGANSSTSYPAPYGDFYNSAKHQFLFRATELNAAGITGGKIDQLEFNVSQIPAGALLNYHEYSISMGCTNATVLGNNWVSGLYNVYTPKNYSVSTGWNHHPFDNAFEWDGISNVVVEICFSEITLGTNYTYNCISPYTTTTFVSCSSDRSDTNPACQNMSPTFLFQNSNNRPNIKFHHCGGTPDSTNYTYSWFPPAGLIDPTAQNTGAVQSAAGTTQYSVIVTDTVSGCLDTAYISITATAPSTININAGNDTTICPGTPTVLTATGATDYTWSPATALSSTNTASTTASPITTITYTVTGLSECITGPAYDSVKVTVHQLTSPLTVNAGSDQDLCGTAVYNLSGITSGGFGGNVYNWTLISGSPVDSVNSSSSLNASVSPTTENTNVYQLLVTDMCGDTASDYVVVNVVLECTLDIPNVFTPNGDGKNDEFRVSALGIKTYSATIFDRWGKKVFISTNINESWNGKGAADGTYFYLITAETITGKQFDEKGYLQLIGN